MVVLIVGATSGIVVDYFIDYDTDVYAVFTTG
jgi:hypothetical protein